MFCELESHSFDSNNKNEWAFSIARYIVCILATVGVDAVCVFLYDIVHKQMDFNVQRLGKMNRYHLGICAVSLAVLYYNEQKLYADQYLLVIVAYFVVKYPEIAKGANLTCGITLALSYVEGYLNHVIPSDGGQINGLLGNIRAFESSNRIVVPVKKLFIIITKSMYCPPDLNEFNDKSDREDVARLEACQSLEPVEKDVAGVKNRKYSSSVYKIIRPGKRPVYVVAECASSLHTFHKIINNRALYEELANVCAEDIVSDFNFMLRKVLPKLLQLKDKCEIIYFDDNKNLNLADVLLDRIKTLESQFEEHIMRRQGTSK